MLECRFLIVQYWVLHTAFFYNGCGIFIYTIFSERVCHTKEQVCDIKYMSLKDLNSCMNFLFMHVQPNTISKDE
jgi:hypothetical protein